MSKINIGVIGVGHLGRLHTQQLKEVEEANLVGIYDADFDRATAVAKEFSTTAFDSIEKLIKSVDALSIVTPTTTHFDLSKQALNAGKHIFIEKPIMESYEQAEKIVSLKNERNLKIQVGHIERFNPAIMALAPLEINPLFIEAHRMANFNPRGTDVAVVMDLMIHDIDLILSFVKSKVMRVEASGASIISPTADIANCRILFENGCVANVTASRISAKKMRKMRFFQPDAYISVDFLDGVSEIYYTERPSFQPKEGGLAFSLGQIQNGAETKNIRYTRLEKAELNPLRFELQQFCKSIINDTEPLVTAEDGTRALRIAREIMSRIDEHTELVKTHWKLR